jgi:hypothetical protein
MKYFWIGVLSFPALLLVLLVMSKILPNEDIGNSTEEDEE